MAREHPLPTVTTVKALYGMAVRCAAPACLEPLYRRSADGQVPLLNSQVCHIAARCLGGPRWDAAMTAQENAGASNLLLLCRSHHAEVDDLALVHLYPVDLLREWKADQIRLAEQLSQSFELTNEQAEEVLAVSFNIQMYGETFNLGGQGGSFGGGGGGGAAWGAGAVGGQGGDGGHVNLNGGDGAAPGGGGGGSGWMAPDARPWPPGAAPAGHLGAAHVPGVDGLPGGDTSFGNPDDPFFVVTAGGAAARAGSGVRQRSDRVGVSSMLLVESAQVVDGKAYVLGGAWNRMTLLNVPQTVSLQLLLVLEAAGAPAGDYTVHLELTDPQGVKSLLMTFPLVISEAGDLVRCPVHLIAQAGITTYGLWTLMASSDVQKLAQQSFTVTRAGSE